VCVVCQNSGCQIHHVDKNNSNNSENNLVVLCHRHHDEAHTFKELSRNLDSGALLDSKRKWLETVNERRRVAATVSGQLASLPKNSIFSIGLSWGYINHRRVVQLANPDFFNSKTQALLSTCVARSIVDSNAIVLKPPTRVPQSSPIGNTVYDWFPHGDDQRLHMLYSNFVDQISLSGKLFHLEPEAWSAAVAKEMLTPGMIIFTQGSFFFKKVSATAENEHRRCHAKHKNLSLEFFVDTVDMFGTTSITVSFSGRQNCAALVLIKSLNESEDGSIEIAATPLALGVCFQPTSGIQTVVPNTIPHITSQ
jgi:hypothetical protein